MAQFVTIFLFQGIMWMTYFAFFANTGLMIPFLHYTCLKTMLLLGKMVNRTWNLGGWEQGAESIHKVINIFRRTYSSIQPASKRLDSMINEYFRSVQPDSKSLKPQKFQKHIFLSSNIVHADIPYSNLFKIMVATMTNCSFSFFALPPLIWVVLLRILTSL